jgi:hypothetical protein
VFALAFYSLTVGQLLPRAMVCVSSDNSRHPAVVSSGCWIQAPTHELGDDCTRQRSALKQSRWYEYVLRFGLGGLATVMAGAIAQFFGPEAGRFAPRLSGDLLVQARHWSKNTSANVSKSLGFPEITEASQAAAVDAVALDKGTNGRLGPFRQD